MTDKKAHQDLEEASTQVDDATAKTKTSASTKADKPEQVSEQARAINASSGGPQAVVQHHTPAPKRPKTNRWGVSIGLLALILSVLTALGGVYLARQLANLEASTVQVQQAQNQRIDSLDVSPQLTHLSQWLEELQQQGKVQDQAIVEQIKTIERSLLVLQQHSAFTSRDWVMATARYLLQIAQYRLTLAGDLTTATEAMRAADAQLHSLADLRLLPVREVLAEEIRTLREMPKPDVEGNVLAIIQLSQRSNELPLAVQLRPKNSPSSETAPNTAEPSNTEKNFFFNRLVAMVQKLFKVQRLVESDDTGWARTGNSAVLSQRASLQLSLQRAQTAALRRDQADYLESLNRAQSIVMDNFAIDTEAVQRFLHDLAMLLQSPVRPKPAGIGRALQLLDEIGPQWSEDS